MVAWRTDVYGQSCIVQMSALSWRLRSFLCWRASFLHRNENSLMFTLSRAHLAPANETVDVRQCFGKGERHLMGVELPFEEIGYEIGNRTWGLCADLADQFASDFMVLLDFRDTVGAILESGQHHLQELQP